MPPFVSVVICCYNSVPRLPETLAYLSRQQSVAGLVWELVIVNNASTDNTVQVAEAWAQQHPSLRVRLVHELNPGLNHARKAGFRAAEGEWVLGVDDDNWLAPDFLVQLYGLVQRHPDWDVIGAYSEAVCEGGCPAWFAQHQGWYAVSGRPVGTRHDGTETDFVWGAGTAFRRRALMELLELDGNFLTTDRKGSALDAGGDNEICFLLRRRGQRIVRSPLLYFQHYLPARRLTWSYLRQLHRAAGRVSVPLDRYRLGDERSGQGVLDWCRRSWAAQVIHVGLQLARYSHVVWRGPLEGQDVALRYELYRGRWEALHRHRNEYAGWVRPAVQEATL